MRNAEPRTTKRLEENVRFNVLVSLEYTVYYAAHSQVRQAAGNGRKAWYLSPFNPKLKVQHVLLDQSMAILSFLSPHLQCAFGHTLKRIKIVQINSVQVVNGRIDITRYCQIDHEERSMPASAQ